MPCSWTCASPTSGGNAGDLENAVIKDASGNTLQTYYYRYYTDDTNGYPHALKYVFNPEAYQRLAAAFSNPLTATDSQVAPYADYFFEYDTDGRVSEEQVAGTGSSANNGIGTFTYAYVTSSNSAGYNSWAVKTTEGLPDGTSQIVYTNAYGEVMLNIHSDGTNSWDTFYEFDSSGRIILTASPSAVNGYNDSYADLLHYSSGSYQYLNNTSGLITIDDYYGSTTAGTTTAGGVAGYLEDVKIEQGQDGTAILQSTTEYYAVTVGSQTIAPVASNTVYRNTDGTGGETTSYAYTFFSGTAQMQSETVTLPSLSSGQNGSGTAGVDTTYFDIYGRPIWHKDAKGAIDYIQYDQATGAIVKSIIDVNTSDTSEFTGLPSGWTTVSGGGLNLVTQLVVDGLGRTTEETDPAGNITYTVYDDVDHEMRVYPGWNSSTDLPTGPTQVYREDSSGSYVETLTMSATPNLTSGVPNGTESIGSIQSLSRAYVNSGGQVVRQDDYFNLSGVTYSTSNYIGTVNTNFYTTTIAYDSDGRANRVLHPTGTIERTVYDSLGRVVSTWVGTNDTPTSGAWSPSNNTGSSNMVEVSSYVYDSGGVGDGNLTQETDYPGGSAANRVTNYYYDWRDRLVATKQGVQTSEDSTTFRPIIYVTYDNLNQATETQEYDGDGVTISISSGVPQAPSSSLLRAQSETSYDDLGQVYQTQTFEVNQSSGSVSSSALTTNYYRDLVGNVIAESDPGGLWTKTKFDGAGRPTFVYITDGAGGTTYAEASSVASDNVLEQDETQYDADSNPILQITRQRFDNETTTGALANPTTAPKARVYYVASYYDSASRLIATANAGTDGGSAWTRPSSVPSDSATLLVTSQTYSNAGLPQTVTDPRGIETKTLYDNLGRVTETIADYTDGTPTSTSNQTIAYGYDGDNNTTYVEAVLPSSAIQKTLYVYGVTTSSSNVNSNDILATVEYPDPSTGSPSTSREDSYTVNALGQNLTYTDRNGNVHTYTYDVLGRQTSDTITTLGTNVDGSVRRIDTAYNALGLPYLFTSYSNTSGTTIVNQVEDVFNGLGQLTKEYQEHSGAVNTSTSLSVQYGYTEMSGGANNSRLTSLTYPNGRVIDYNYASGVDSTISRVTSISDSSGTLESETYLGLNTVVQRTYPQPGIALSYIQQSGDSSALTDGGDRYTGLDRFGQVIDQNWLVTSSGSTLSREQFAHDQDGNVVYANNLVDSVFSDLYAYDNFNQLASYKRGTLSASTTGGPLDTVSSPTDSQSWSTDAVGNFTSVTTNGTAQTRTANQDNQITSVSSATTPTYDSNGNLTTDERGYTYVYDAWNRLVTVKNGSATTVASYTYDALGRRNQQTSSGTTTDVYFNSSWQAIEERVSGAAKVQYVWSPTGGDTLVERDRDVNSDGTWAERLYVMQGPNGNVAGLVNTSGTVVERYAYQPYGQVTYLSAGWTSLSSSAYGMLYLFQSGRFDLATGLYNFRNRDLSPTLERWLEHDPLGFAGGDINVYRPEGNNPATLKDSFGLTATGGSFVYVTSDPAPVSRSQTSALGVYVTGDPYQPGGSWSGGPYVTTGDPYQAGGVWSYAGGGSRYRPFPGSLLLGPVGPYPGLAPLSPQSWIFPGPGQTCLPGPVFPRPPLIGVEPWTRWVRRLRIHPLISFPESQPEPPRPEDRWLFPSSIPESPFATPIGVLYGPGGRSGD